MMISQEISTRQNTKRKRVTSIEAVPTSDPPPQPHRGEKKLPHLHNRPSSKFWDNLSRIWLTPSALREFDRRAAQLVISTPKYPSDLNGYPVRDLGRFARRGGPSLGDLRGYAEALSEGTMNSSQSQGTRASGVSLDPLQKKKKITAYDKNFEQCLIDSGIPPCGEDPDPENWHELNIRLARRRPSLLRSRFSEEDFKNFRRNIRNAKSEAEVTTNVLIIRGNSAIISGQKRTFNNLTPLNEQLAAASPDFFDGSLPANLDLRVRNELGNYIMPSKKLNSPLLPNFFLEIGGPQGSPAVLLRQITQDLAYGARALLEMQSYSNRGCKYDGNAYTIGSIYDGIFGSLKFFTMYLTQPADLTGRPIYHMIPIRSFDLTQDAATCRDGITWFRNSRDFAKEVRDAAIAHANQTAHDQNEGASASMLTNHPPVSTGVAGLVPGSWLAGPCTFQAQESLITQDAVYNTSGIAYEEPERFTDELNEEAGSLVVGMSKIRMI